MSPPKKAAAKTAPKLPERKPESAKKADPLPHLQAWHDAQCHIDTIDAQTGPGAPLSPRDADRLAEQRAEHVKAQQAAVEALT
jgi:hypothetical protein